MHIHFCVFMECVLAKKAIQELDMDTIRQGTVLCRKTGDGSVS